MWIIPMDSNISYYYMLKRQKQNILVQVALEGRWTFRLRRMSNVSRRRPHDVALTSNRRNIRMFFFSEHWRRLRDVYRTLGKILKKNKYFTSKRRPCDVQATLIWRSRDVPATLTRRSATSINVETTSGGRHKKKNSTSKLRQVLTSTRRWSDITRDVNLTLPWRWFDVGRTSQKKNSTSNLRQVLTSTRRWPNFHTMIKRDVTE